MGKLIKDNKCLIELETATSEKDGLMSATDKAKFDNLGLIESITNTEIDTVFAD